MPKIKQYQDLETGKIIERRVFSLNEQGEYHANRAKKDSINPKTNKPYSAAARAYSRGYLNARQGSAVAFKHKNPDYQRINK